MSSAYEHPQVVSNYLSEECSHGRILGPFDLSPVPQLYVSRFGVIPKRHHENKWRLILDLSSPEGSSVNNGIDKELCSLSYVSVDDIAADVLQLGQGALIAKTDVKHAYRQIPVHPDDRPLLGMRWGGQFYVDAVLPFGLRSAPLIFTAVADIFLRRIYDLLAATSHFKPHYTVRLNRECRADIDWWHKFVGTWNGTSLLRQVRTLNPDVLMWSDASGQWGCGAHWQGFWFNLPWELLPIASESIAAKELFPILAACTVWGHLWKGCTVCCHCDNIAVVEVINRQRAKDCLLSHLLRCLFFASAQFDFDVVARHTPGRENGAADALSRNKLPLFFLQVSHAVLSPTPIPIQLAEGLSIAQPHWDADKWTSWYSSILARL